MTAVHSAARTGKPGQSNAERAAGGWVWAVRVAGRFEGVYGAHYLRCPDRANAEARTLWWINYRGTELDVSLCRLEGAYWHVYPLESS